MKKSEDSLKVLWDNIKQTNICIIGLPGGSGGGRGEGGGERRGGVGRKFICRNNSGKLPYIQIQETQ